MMNLFMSRYALLSVLLVVSLSSEVSSTNVKNGMGNTNTNTMPEDEKDVKRKLDSDDDSLLFTKTYISVTKADDFVRLFPNGGDEVAFFNDFFLKTNPPFDVPPLIFKGNPQFPIEGSSATQKGDIFATDSIELVNDKEGVNIVFDGVGTAVTAYQFAGGRKLRFQPVGDSSYFFHGQCTVTSGIFEPQVAIRALTVRASNQSNLRTKIVVAQPVITSQVCKLNLCLGGGGFSCIAIYSGSAFVFNFGKGIVLNNSAIRVPTPAASPSNIKSTFEAPPLPPPFPGTIIGGTGSFEGIEGSVTIATIAGTTGLIIQRATGASSGISPTNFNGPIKPFGNIVQVITVKSNIPLPSGP